MKFRSLLAAATMMALPLVANAQAVNGPYIAGGAGVNFMHDEDIKSLGGVSTSAAIKHNIGPVVVLSGGWGFGNGLRAELEGSFRYNGGNGLNNGGGITTFGGNEQEFGAMANVFYDFVGGSRRYPVCRRRRRLSVGDAAEQPRRRQRHVDRHRPDQGCLRVSGDPRRGSADRRRSRTVADR